MKKNNSITIKIMSMIIICTMLGSCVMTKTSVGAFKESPGKEYTYAKGKQLWLFWGLIPLGRTDVGTPTNGNCEVITKYRFSDVLISSLTGGLVMSYSIKVKAKKLE